MLLMLCHGHQTSLYIFLRLGLMLRALCRAWSHAQGIRYSRSLSTGWKPPLKVRRQTTEQAQELRDRFHIIVEGQHLLPPILDFKDMKFPAPVLRQLAAKNITTANAYSDAGELRVLASR